jgi:hypothetical protein
VRDKPDDMMRLSSEAEELISRLAEGRTLKSHRYLDGRKEYRLHPLGAGQAIAVAGETVRQLQQKRLIHSNMKFPAATYLLTERGQVMASKLGAGSQEVKPLTPRNWRD